MKGLLFLFSGGNVSFINYQCLKLTMMRTWCSWWVPGWCGRGVCPGRLWRASSRTPLPAGLSPLPASLLGSLLAPSQSQTLLHSILKFVSVLRKGNIFYIWSKVYEMLNIHWTSRAVKTFVKDNTSTYILLQTLNCTIGRLASANFTLHLGM